MTEDWDFAALAAEELDPELEEWVEVGLFGRSLKHPLVYDVGGIVPGLANRRLRAAKERLAQAEAEKDWHKWVFLHERPWRADALYRVVHEHGEELTDQAYWELIGAVWTDSENVWENTLQWDELLASDRGARTAVMDEDDRAMYDALPDTFTVFRGAQSGVNELGLSWTTDRDKAEWFARRFASIKEDTVPVVLVGEVNKSDVVACFVSRNESEVVVTDEYVVSVTEEENV